MFGMTGFDPPIREFNVTISQTLSKSTAVKTNDYEKVSEYDDDGMCTISADTSDTDWVSAYKKDHYTIPELLKILKEYVEKDIEYQDTKYSKSMLNYILKECEGWIEDELEVVED